MTNRIAGVCVAAAAVVVAFGSGAALGGAAEGPATEPDEAAYARALQPIEAQIKAWDFAGAGAALAKLRFESPELAERLATRRAEAALLARLKAKMIAAINDAKPRLRKGTLLIPGLNGDLVLADEQAIVAEVPGKGTEKHPWAELGPRTLQRLLQRCTDRRDPNDLIASALLALIQGDVAGAEADFAAARVRGANVDPYLVPLADAALAKALALLDERRFDDASPALAALEAKYAGTAWLAAHKEAIAAARRRARGGAANDEAEKLYAHAAKLFQEKDLFELKAAVEKLQADFAGTDAVTDATRKPSVAEMAEATAKLGKILTVRQKGKADFTSIQEAVTAAPPNSLVLVADGATYHEIVRVPAGKEGLILRGKKGVWPVITSDRHRLKEIADLVRTDCPGVTIEGFVLNHCANESVGGAFACVDALKPPVRVRSCILYMAWSPGQVATVTDKEAKPDDVIAEFDHCVVVVPSRGGFWSGHAGIITMTNSIWIQGIARTMYSEPPGMPQRIYRFANCVLRAVHLRGPADLRSCTLLDRLVLDGQPNLVRDCIVPCVQASKRETAIEHCDVHGTPAFGDFAKAGKGTISEPPEFQDPAQFDSRLRPASPCRKAASDGGDIGCRYTPEMLEMLKKTLELRSKGIIRF